MKGWTMDGSQIFDLKGHTNLVYAVSVAQDSSNEIISASEDKTVKIWKNMTCIETIQHPKCVWKGIVLPNGDLVTAGADYYARVFTRKQERMAPPAIQEGFNDAVKQSRKGPDGLDIDKLVKVADLVKTVGKKDGETKIVNNEGNAEAWIWNKAKNAWEKFGDVTADVADGRISDNNSGKKFLDGKFYDYVFNIETDSGVMKKIGYNIGGLFFKRCFFFLFANIFFFKKKILMMLLRVSLEKMNFQ